MQSKAPPLHALTSIRGIAAWWVVMYHFREAMPAFTPEVVRAVTAHGYLAVDLFFQLSGFVIALNYAGRFRHLDLANIKEFLWRRLARIYPLHIFMLGAFLVSPLAISLFSTQKDLGGRYSPGYFLLSLLLMQNWGFTDRIAWNIPAWSISTEWFAYLLFPGLAWILLRWKHSAVIGVAFLVGLAAFSQISGLSLGADIERFGLLRCVLEFAIGACVFLASRMLSGRYANLALMGALASFLVYALSGIIDGVIIPTGFALLLYSLSTDQSLLARAIGGQSLEFIGEISYSTYMVHFFVKDWTKFLFVRPEIPLGLAFAIYVATTALASLALYKLVENPARRRMQQLSSRNSFYGSTRSSAAAESLASNNMREVDYRETAAEKRSASS
jgi:peptidoglycan/LPS O-acetylase OafA/YrhL